MEDAGVGKEKYKIDWGETLTVLCLTGLAAGQRAPPAGTWSSDTGWVFDNTVMQQLLQGKGDLGLIQGSLNAA